MQADQQVWRPIGRTKEKRSTSKQWASKTQGQSPPIRMGDSFAADQVINSLNDFSQEPGIPTCPLQGVVSWKSLSLFSKRAFFDCLVLKAHAGNRPGQPLWENLTWGDMAATDTAFPRLGPVPQWNHWAIARPLQDFQSWALPRAQTRAEKCKICWMNPSFSKQVRQV